MDIKEEQLLTAKAAFVFKKPIPLPIDGHWNHPLADNIHLNTARELHPELDVTKEMGYIGRIRMLDITKGEVIIACACGMLYIASIDEFNVETYTPNVARISPLNRNNDRRLLNL